ncbi:MAG: hypothetical protein IPM00_09720 [Tetrasphaera sp.]|nr:hypothetical protein [Tetrasphaera sp.]
MAHLGMDAEVVESVGKQLRQQGQAISSVVRAVDAMVNSADSKWWGGRARSFVGEWRGSHRVMLTQLARAIDEFGQTAIKNVSDQRAVSASGATPSTSPSSHQERSLRDYASLVGAAYGGSETHAAGYEVLSDAELSEMGIDPASLNDKRTGFQAVVLRGYDGRLVVSFAGTNDTNDIFGDIVAGGRTPDTRADFEGSHGTTAQSAQALALGLKVAQYAGKDNVEFVGHSLGGRNAAIAAIATGSKAVTFNAAGVSDRDIEIALATREAPENFVEKAWYSSPAAAAVERARLLTGDQIVSHLSSGDPLTWAQNAGAVAPYLVPPTARHAYVVGQMTGVVPAPTAMSVGRPEVHFGADFLSGPAHEVKAISDPGANQI